MHFCFLANWALRLIRTASASVRSAFTSKRSDGVSYSVAEDSYDSAVTNNQVFECALFEIFSYEVNIVNKGIYRILRCWFRLLKPTCSTMVLCRVARWLLNAALTSVYEGVSLSTRSVVAISIFPHNVEKSSFLLLFRFILKPGDDPVALEASKPFRPQFGLV